MKYLLIVLAGLLCWDGSSQVQPNLDSLLLRSLQSKDSSAYYFTQAKKLLKSPDDTANYFYHKFFEKDANRKTDSTNYFADLAIPMLESIDSLDRIRKIYERLHFQELRAGRYEGSLNYAQLALNTAERLKDTARMSLHLSDISIVYHDFEDYSRGVEYGKKAYQIMNEASEVNYRYLIFANNATGINFDDWGMADSALYYHFNNLDLLGHMEDSLPYTFIFNNIGNTYLKQNKFRDSRKYINKALELNLRRGRKYNLATNYTNLATIAYKMGDYQLAKNEFILANKYANESESIEKIRDVVQQEAWFYKEIGDFEKALERQEAFYKLRDSVFNEERAASFAEMETKYETEKKEKALAETRADLAERELQVKRKNTLIYGGFGLALILGLLGYLVFSRQKLKNRQLKKESELKTALARIETQNKLQEQRLRISRDLHDNIGSQLTFVTSSVDNLKFGLKDKEGAIPGKLSMISEFTTQTIYELRDTIWAMNKNEITFEDLQVRISNFIEKANKSRDNVAFNFQVSENIPADTTFSSLKGINIYRIIQEGVNNALKYSDATEIKVNVLWKGDQFLLEIIDNGIGFDIEKIERGNGLTNINKRAKELGGTSLIDSAKGKGTRISVQYPK